jgi:UDP-N-acetylglucosamine 2-epimerase (non-hydrolysing)
MGAVQRTVLLVFGTRPEAVKMAPVFWALREQPSLRPIVCVTGQHRQMLDQALELFTICPDHDLNLMRPDQTLADLTARTLTAVAVLLDQVRPDLVLVQGDTAAAMAAALAAFFARIPAGHIEAGLRTGDLANPFPEELNRRVVTLAARLHFAPTAAAREALLAEGVPSGRIYLTGNTVVDALRAVVDRAAAAVPPPAPGRRLVLVTVHRRESFGAPLEDICAALLAIAERYPEVEVVYPVHLNPRVRGPVSRLLGGHPRIRLLDPLDYITFVGYLAHAAFVLTDSGGVQEEASVLGKPMLVLRTETERPEGVAAGAARLVGTDPASITAAVAELLTDQVVYTRMAQARSLYGDGHAGQRIADICRTFLGETAAPLLPA